MATKYDLPNSLIHEWQKYGELFALGDSRTTTGSGSWTSDTSSTVYNYTTGEEDLFDQLFVVLQDYLVSATDFNNKADANDLMAHEAEKASKTAFGHVKVGDRLSVTAGVISADVQVETASGSYVGDGEEDRFIQVGFTPKFVYLSRGVGGTSYMFMCQSTSGATFHKYTSGGGEHEGITTLRITTNGFIVSSDGTYSPNRNGNTYLWTCYS